MSPVAGALITIATVIAAGIVFVVYTIAEAIVKQELTATYLPQGGCSSPELHIEEDIQRLRNMPWWVRLLFGYSRERIKELLAALEDEL